MYFLSSRCHLLLTYYPLSSCKHVFCGTSTFNTASIITHTTSITADYSADIASTRAEYCNYYSRYDFSFCPISQIIINYGFLLTLSFNTVVLWTSWINKLASFISLVNPSSIWPNMHLLLINLYRNVIYSIQHYTCLIQVLSLVCAYANSLLVQSLTSHTISSKWFLQLYRVSFVFTLSEVV